MDFDTLMREQQVNLGDLTCCSIFDPSASMVLGCLMAGITPVLCVGATEADNSTAKANGFSTGSPITDINSEAQRKKYRDELKQSLKGRAINLLLTHITSFKSMGMLDLVDSVGFDYILMEGHKSVVSRESTGILHDIKSGLVSLGYSVNAKVICASSYGVPQLRERTFVLANRFGLSNDFPDSTCYKPLPAGPAIEDLMHIEDSDESNHIRPKHKEDMVAKMRALDEGGHLYEKFVDTWKRITWDKPSDTIKDSHGCAHIHPRLPRALTIREMARLQSFPDAFRFVGSRSEQCRIVGNAVPPLVCKEIGLKIRKELEDL